MREREREPKLQQTTKKQETTSDAKSGIPSSHKNKSSPHRYKFELLITTEKKHEF